MSLRLRLGLATGIAVAVAVVAVAVSAYAGTGSELRGQVDSQLRGLVQRVDPPGHGNVYPGSAPGGGGTSGFVPGGNGFALHRHLSKYGGANGILELIAPGGTVHAGGPATRTTIPVDARIRSTARAGKGSFYTDATVGGTHLRLLVTGIGARGAIVVALPLTTVDHALSHELLLLAIIAAAGIALAALLSVFVARSALKPITRFTRQTEAIAASPERIETDRLQVSGRDELARLAHTFNDTLDALESSVVAQRNLVADASHELRTPITTIRANLQLMRDEALLSPADREALRTDVIEELDELTALVSDVVELARGSKPSAAPGDVRLDEVVTAALERTRRRAPQLTVTAELEPTLVRGEGDRIARAVANLLDNATKYGSPGGAIEVTLHEGALAVRDHGPGFEADDLPFVFDRFHRARGARAKPGSGLGLAIVRQAAEAHGGTVTAANAPDGGALMTIGFGPAQRLPAQAAVAQTP